MNDINNKECWSSHKKRSLWIHVKKNFPESEYRLSKSTRLKQYKIYLLAWRIQK